MRRLLRILLNAATVASLALCVAAAILWWRGRQGIGQSGPKRAVMRTPRLLLIPAALLAAVVPVGAAPKATGLPTLPEVLRSGRDTTTVTVH